MTFLCTGRSQSLANELLALAQEYTADPRTDTKLGKVGVGM